LTPTQTSASSVLYDFADAKIRLQAEADDYLTVRLDGRPRKKTAPHKFDATDLIGYVVVDIPQNSQIAVVMESNTRLQAQVRITPKGFVFNMSGNDEAADFLLTMLSLLS
jgi:hypothetical protein